MNTKRGTSLSSWIFGAVAGVLSLGLVTCAVLTATPEATRAVLMAALLGFSAGGNLCGVAPAFGRWLGERRMRRR
jgi:hypothetical protein